jgi:hypothetical protein
MVDDTCGMCRAGQGSSVEDEMTVLGSDAAGPSRRQSGANSLDTTTNLSQRPDRSFNVSVLQRCSRSYI